MSSIINIGIMKNISITFLLLFSLCICAQAKKDTSVKYEIESAGPAKTGTYLVHVWVYSKSGKVSEEKLKYAAIHGVIFRGFSGDLVSERPLAKTPSVEQERKEFFEEFFSEKGGSFVNYASIVPGQMRKMQTSTGEIKVGTIITVQKDLLKQYLVDAGIIKGLNSGF